MKKNGFTIETFEKEARENVILNLTLNFMELRVHKENVIAAWFARLGITSGLELPMLRENAANQLNKLRQSKELNGAIETVKGSAKTGGTSVKFGENEVGKMLARIYSEFIDDCITTIRKGIFPVQIEKPVISTSGRGKAQKIKVEWVADYRAMQAILGKLEVKAGERTSAGLLKCIKAQVRANKPKRNATRKATTKKAVPTAKPTEEKAAA